VQYTSTPKSYLLLDARKKEKERRGWVDTGLATIYIYGRIAIEIVTVTRTLVVYYVSHKFFVYVFVLCSEDTLLTVR
jgi:hypothetical protein